MSGEPTLMLSDVSVKRGGKLLISELSLTLSGPKLLWIVGGNGIGKTSLLLTCAGISRPESGQVGWAVDGVDVLAPEAVSFLPSNSYAKPALTAAEDAKFWNANLKNVDLDRHNTTHTRSLSTGQIKRLSFAKLLAAKKPIWILDEPLAGLDELGRGLIAGHLKTHVKNGGLALVASHAPMAVEGIPTQKLALG